MNPLPFIRSSAFCLIALLAISASCLAQTGSISGKIAENLGGKSEPIIGAFVNIDGTSKTVTTDTAGYFLLKDLEPGVYTVKITYIGYTPKVLMGVRVIKDKRTPLGTVQIQEDTKTTEEVEIVGTRNTGTDVSVLKEIKTLDVVASGISNEQIRRTLDRDAADVARRVSGVTVVDDRFVIVRGLSERYNAVMLNGVLAPSFEQDVKSFSLDNLPSQYIDRMVVYKSPSPDLPGDFAGGVVKIYTHGMPAKNSFGVGFSSSYRQGTTGREFLSTPQGKLGWLGYDDGTYAFPKDVPPDYNTATGGDRYDNIKIGKLFKNDGWAPTSSTASPDIRFNIQGAYRWKLSGTKMLGIISGINYSNTKVRWYDARQALFLRPNPKKAPDDELFLLQAHILDVHTINIRTSALQNFFLQLNSRHTIEWKNTYTHSAQNRYRNAYSQTSPLPTENQLFPDKIVTTQNINLWNTFGGVVSSQLSGKHAPSPRLDLNWALNYAQARRDEPDIKNYVIDYSQKNGYLYFNNDESPEPTNFGRMFFRTDEQVKTLTSDAAYKLYLSTDARTEVSLKGGWYLEEKQRTFASKGFGASPRISLPGTDGGYYNDMYVINPTTGKRIMGTLSPTDLNKASSWNNYSGFVMAPTGEQGSYYAQTTMYAYYGMAKWKWRNKINLTGGFRLENYTSIIQGYKLFFQDWLPSLNASYNLTSKWLLRGSFGKTVNRPEIREGADLQTYDYYYMLYIKGNSSLKRSNVNNYDLKVEYYPSPDQMISLGIFYKEFTNPIERIFVNDEYRWTELSTYTITYLNAAKSYSQGIEADLRLSLKNILMLKGYDPFKHLSITGNASLLQSRLFYTRENLNRTGVLGLAAGATPAPSSDMFDLQDEFINANSGRPMFAQSPYTVNAGLTYNNERTKTMVNTSYNIIGKRLAILIPYVGSIYEVPRHQLDITLVQGIGKHIEIKAGIQDIFNQKIQFIQDVDRNGDARRLSGTGYETDVNNNKNIYQGRYGLELTRFYYGPPPPGTIETESKNTYNQGDIEQLGFRRGRYYSLGVTVRF